MTLILSLKSIKLIIFKKNRTQTLNNYYFSTKGISLLENRHFSSRFSPQAMAYLMWTITRWQHCNYCEFYKGFSHEWEKYMREKSYTVAISLFC